MKGIKNKLQKILLDINTTDLQRAVVEDILDSRTADEMESYIKDVLQYGCISGTVSGLIYYNDTAIFYRKYCEDIDNIYSRLEDELGEAPKLSTPLSNSLAWLGYEETMREIANIIELEY